MLIWFLSPASGATHIQFISLPRPEARPCPAHTHARMERGLVSWQASQSCAKNDTNYADIWRR